MCSPSLPAKALFRLSVDEKRAPAAFPLGLGETGLHEVCEASYGDFSALTGFALAASLARKGAVIWVQQARLGLEHGRLLHTGLPHLTKSPHDIMHVAAHRLTDALWATEEAIRSGAIGLIVAELAEADFTATRRLALASGRHGVPVILLMPYAREGATAASVRWRLSARASAPNRYDPRGLGVVRWKAVLERSRQAPHMAGHVFDLELDDETLSLRVVPGLAAHTSPARTPRAEDRLGSASLRQTG